MVSVSRYTARARLNFCHAMERRALPAKATAILASIWLGVGHTRSTKVSANALDAAASPAAGAAGVTIMEYEAHLEVGRELAKVGAAQWAEIVETIELRRAEAARRLQQERELERMYGE
jgi:hypothetical protein